MKKTIFLIFLFVFVLFLVSCSSTPKKSLVPCDCAGFVVTNIYDAGTAKSVDFYAGYSNSTKIVTSSGDVFIVSGRMSVFSGEEIYVYTLEDGKGKSLCAFAGQQSSIDIFDCHFIQ